MKFLNKTQFKISLRLGVISFLFCLFPSLAFGASVSLAASKSTLTENKQFEISVMLDAEDQHINATSGKIVLPSEFKINSVSTLGSVVNFWLSSPTKYSDNTILWSGIIAGGFDGVRSPFYTGGKPGVLFKILATPTSEGEFDIQASLLEAYLNDGKGTAVSVSSNKLSVSVIKGTSSATLPSLAASSSQNAYIDSGSNSGTELVSTSSTSTELTSKPISADASGFGAVLAATIFIILLSLSIAVFL